jgi:hypothetical protein
VPRGTIWRPQTLFDHDAAMHTASRAIRRLVCCAAAFLPAGGGLVQPTLLATLLAMTAAAGEDGETEAVGIGTDLERAWSLELCRGPHRAGPIEPVAWANLLGTQRGNG